MGLDIYACSNVTKSANQGLDDCGDPVDPHGRHVYINEDFPDRCAEFDGETVYVFGQRDHYYGRSYGSYNGWRNELAGLAGYGDARGAWSATSGPFWELINFSDCEGSIGTRVCVKLAKDFADFQEKADAHPSEEFRYGYTQIRRAFEAGSKNGFVEFW